ncbi:hypothetical protein N8198_10545, partial [Gammaproteobacteria bacterium]|nr:hypothetical protein [Gammaproteobacteria bacterium]
MLLPIPTRSAFHPKITMLAGKTKGFLAVGSHNLTYSGFGNNREITNAIYYDSKSRSAQAPLFQEAWNVLHQWMESAHVDAESRPLLDRLPQLAPWIEGRSITSNQDIQLLTGEPNEYALFSKMLDFVNRPLSDIFLTGPFFDSKLEFVKNLINVLEPERLTIAVDPDTAQIPATARSHSSINFVRASSIGPKQSHYLHAKIFYATGRDGTQYLLSGSANPSSPAWLRADETSNHEAMIALRGKEAEKAARNLGLPLGEEEMPLDDADWENVAARWASGANREATASKPYDTVFVSLADDGFVSIPMNKRLGALSAILVGMDGIALQQKPKLDLDSDQAIRVLLPKEQRIGLIHVSQDDELVRIAIVHYPAALHDKAKTGVQKRFSSAFGSLDSDTPALSDLFKCVEQVLDEEQQTAPKKLKSSGGQSQSPDENTPETLEISVKDIKQARGKRQLSAGTNLGYILDVLIRSLGHDLVRDYEEVDTFGRSEEEQIGSDDEDTQSAAKSRAKAQDVLS